MAQRRSKRKSVAFVMRDRKGRFTKSRPYRVDRVENGKTVKTYTGRGAKRRAAMDALPTRDPRPRPINRVNRILEGAEGVESFNATARRGSLREIDNMIDRARRSVRRGTKSVTLIVHWRGQDIMLRNVNPASIGERAIAATGTWTDIERIRMYNQGGSGNRIAQKLGFDIDDESTWTERQAALDAAGSPTIDFGLTVIED